uniref:Peptidase S1 domain-containing protein n=1 Tax=Anopheles epiroticus TaxID=199890 RepID=A0A182PPE5_9DIPT
MWSPLLLFLVIALQQLDQAVGQLRQIGGRDVPILEYPFMAAIAFQKQLAGNGAIIGPRWVITSASAVFAPTDSLFDVQVGADSFSGPGSWYEVRAIFKHPEFIGWDHNIALIHLKGPIKYSDTVQPIELADVFIEQFQVTMLSYGINENDSRHLREALYDASSNNECVQFLTDGLAKQMVMDQRGFCVRALPGTQQGQWYNDAGAPIVAYGKLHGVFAFAETEGGINQGAVGTRIYAFLDWIRATMAKHN